MHFPLPPAIFALVDIPRAILPQPPRCQVVQIIFLFFPLQLLFVLLLLDEGRPPAQYLMAIIQKACEQLVTRAKNWSHWQRGRNSPFELPVSFNETVDLCPRNIHAHLQRFTSGTLLNSAGGVPFERKPTIFTLKRIEAALRVPKDGTAAKTVLLFMERED